MKGVSCRDCLYRGLKFDEISLSVLGLDDAYIAIRLAYHLGVNSVWDKA